MNRFKNELPKIGVRVVVDGRCGGVREKIEQPTFELARNVKKLIESKLKHPSGEEVEVYVSKIAVGGATEAAIVSEDFSKNNIGGIISVTKAWAYGAEVLEMDKTIPQAIWGFNGSERPGAVYLAGAIATSEQKGLPVFKIYGRDVQDAIEKEIPADVACQILEFAKCALVVATMKKKSYLSMGSVSMGIGGSIISPELFQDYFDMRNESVDMSEFIRRIDNEIYDKQEYARARDYVKKTCKTMADPNPADSCFSDEKKREVWDYCVKMALIARDLMVGNSKLKEMGYSEEALGHNAILAGFQGQRSWTDFLPNGDFMEAVLNSSFDWNGVRQPYIISTENDSLNGLSMLFGHLLTGKAQIFADVRTYWSREALIRVTGKDNFTEQIEDGFIYLTNSGAAALEGCGEMKSKDTYEIKPHWLVNEDDIKACQISTKWGAAKHATFRGGGFSSSFTTRGGLPFTMVRLNLLKGLGPAIQIVEGHSIDIGEIQSIIVSRTDPTWPKTFFVPRLNKKPAFKDVYSVMKKWGSNHCSLCHGHIGASLITLASMFRIPVSLHNVDEEDIFRPSAWDAFGCDSLQNADYLACKTYGPLYK